MNSSTPESAEYEKPAYLDRLANLAVPVPATLVKNTVHSRLTLWNQAPAAVAALRVKISTSLTT